MILIFATIIALPIGRASSRNDGHYIFADTENLETWPTGWTFMLAWLSPIWTVGGVWRSLDNLDILLSYASLIVAYIYRKRPQMRQKPSRTGFSCQ